MQSTKTGAEDRAASLSIAARRLSFALLACSYACATNASTAIPSTATFTDVRDGRSYRLVEIAGMKWFREGLAYAAAGSYCLDDDPRACARYGRLYTWDLAMRACPPGSHLATEEEWQRLEAHLGMPPDELSSTRGRGPGVGDRLKIGGDSGLDIAFSGWRDPLGAYHAGNGHDLAAALWTATEAGPETAWHRDVSSARPGVWRSEVDKPYSLSVRCVVDAAPTPER